MSLAALEQHIIWSRQEGRTTIYYHYYDWVTWVVLALVVVWLAWLFVRARRRAQARRRPSRRPDRGRLRRLVKLKRELSLTFLRPGFSANIHAVGIGRLAPGGDYCLQVFVRDAGEDLWNGAGGEGLPDAYGGVPLLLLEAPPAVFLPDAVQTVTAAPTLPRQQPACLRGKQEVIVGGISGANANLEGQSGTIGYLCTRRTRLPLPKAMLMLSNTHVFADLRKQEIDDSDLIVQPSPGEPETGSPIGALVNFTKLKFDGGLEDANHVDAALARLWEPLRHRPLIPFIGAVRGHVGKEEVEVGEPARKFGRTTGYTEGCVLSIYADIWIRYDRTGQSAFFADQLLIEPDAERFPQFVDKGDSGSLLVDESQYALGLIFAGASEPPPPRDAAPDADASSGARPSAERPARVGGYGVANPIAEVLDRLKIDLPL